MPRTIFILLAAALTGALLWLYLSGDGKLLVSLSPAAGERTLAIRPVVVDPALLENGASGTLPRIGLDGRMPWRVYRTRLAGNAKPPLLAIVVTNLGLNRKLTKKAIEELPPAVTLGFSPYAEGLAKQVKAARIAGHEVLLAVPMEPIGYPVNDPGERTLLTANSTRQNLGLLRESMTRFPGYVGIVPHMGRRFIASQSHLRPVLAEIKRRGLMFLDSTSVSAGGGQGAKLSAALGLPNASATGWIDDDPSRISIAARLNQITVATKKKGHGVALARLYPVSIEMIIAWMRRLRAEGVTAVPITVVAGIGGAKK
ncbi:MAG: divergent polysaccharide deacetylase family protein [Alphaproteobacteria bacterium]